MLVLSGSACGAAAVFAGRTTLGLELVGAWAFGWVAAIVTAIVYTILDEGE